MAVNDRMAPMILALYPKRSGWRPGYRIALGGAGSLAVMAGCRVYFAHYSLRGLGMQVKQVRWPGLAALVLVSLMVSGCGQKGPLYREAPVPAVENSAETQQSDDKPES